MREVTVEKDQLLATLRENRERHVNTFEQVLEDYRLRAIELLEEHIDRIAKGAVEKVNVVLPPPKNYEEEYNRVIAMVEWSVEKKLTLDEYAFEQWVLDEWDWKGDFNQSIQTYSRS